MTILLLLLVTSLQTQSPRFDWVKFKSVGIVMRTTDKKVGAVTFAPGTRVRLEMQSDSGVNFAFVSADKTQPKGFDPTSISCFAKDVFKTEVECEIPPRAVFVIEDSLRGGTLAAALLSHGRNADKIAAQNRVMLTTFLWKCVEFCDDPATPERCSNGELWVDGETVCIKSEEFLTGASR